MIVIFNKQTWRGLSCWYKILSGLPTISGILSSTSIKTLRSAHSSTSSKDRWKRAYSIGPTILGKLRWILHHLTISQLVQHHLANTQWWWQFVKMPEMVILPSNKGLGAKLGEGISGTDFQPRHLTEWLLTKWRYVTELSTDKFLMVR